MSHCLCCLWWQCWFGIAAINSGLGHRPAVNKQNHTRVSIVALPQAETNKDNEQRDNIKTVTHQRAVGYEWNLIENKERSTSICPYINMFIDNITENTIIMYYLF